MVWLPIIILIPVYGYGWHALQQKFMDPDIKVSVIQGNIPQKEKWATEYVDSILARYQQLTLAAAKDKPQLIIWPETSVPGYILDEPKIFKNIVSLSKKVNTHLLVGSPRESEKGGIYYNSAFLFAGSGEIKKVHDKIHLVPFGEYIPYKNMFWFLQDSAIGDFSPGEHYTLFSLPNNKQKSVQFAVLICFEDIFPSLVRRFRRGGADFFIVITNEAWFKISAEPIQHLAMSVFRAIETRCWFVRAANTGISGFIDPYGKVRAKVERGNEDIFVSGFKSLTLASD